MMDLPEAILVLVASTALALALVAILQLVILKRRIEQVLAGLNSKVLKHVVKSLEKRRKRKNRYLVVRLATSKNVSLNELQKSLDEAFIELYGKKNYSEASPKVLYYGEKTSKAIIESGVTASGVCF